MPIYLAFEHPATGEMLEFRSELPADLARLHHSLAAAIGANSAEAADKSRYKINGLQVATQVTAASR